MAASRERQCKGTNLIDLVKFLRHLRKQRSLTPLSQAAENLLSAQVLPNAWYSHEAFLELLDLTFREVLGSSEAKAYEMGMAGGRVQLQGPHKAFVDAGSVCGSTLGVRHTWRSSFNFGELRAEPAGDRGVLFRLSGYEDVPPVHAYMIAGWGAAAAKLAGAVRPTPRVLSMPRPEDPVLVYDVRW